MITRGGRVDDRMSAPGGRPGQEFTARETESVALFFNPHDCLILSKYAIRRFCVEASADDSERTNSYISGDESLVITMVSGDMSSVLPMM